MSSALGYCGQFVRRYKRSSFSLRPTLSRPPRSHGARRRQQWAPRSCRCRGSSGCAVALLGTTWIDVHCMRAICIGRQACTGDAQFVNINRLLIRRWHGHARFGPANIQQQGASAPTPMVVQLLQLLKAVDRT
jgi:hypothetical protein